MADYSKLLDDETRAFIAQTDSYYPPDAVDLPVAGQREVYDRMCRAFFSGYPDGITAETTAVAAEGRDIPVRIYRNAQANGAAVVIYYHGGGFILGGLESHDDVCAELCERTGFELISVDYRLAPEHQHPAAYDDAMAAFDWVSEHYSAPIILCGDSAGGNLAAAVAHATRGNPRAPIGQMLIYPGLGGDRTTGSYIEHADAPMLTTRDIDFYGDIRAGGRDVADDPTAAPLADTDFTGLPATVTITAECDPLSSNGEAYRDRILAAGGKAVWREEKGLVHGYLRGRGSVTRARQSFDRIVVSLKALAAGELPDFD
ncbi:MAG: alpha/beta hydrolase [Rhizobiaceae bacterium]|nr:alpha/beta hydrolase [Rhizobiaceae bacterium]